MSVTDVSRNRAALIIACITGTGIGNLLAGLLTVGIPAIAADLEFPPTQQLWPTAQIGKRVGITTSAVIARHITAQLDAIDPKEALLHGYQAGWWYNCAFSFFSVVVSFLELRSLGKLDIKTE